MPRTSTTADIAHVLEISSRVVPPRYAAYAMTITRMAKDETASLQVSPIISTPGQPGHGATGRQVHVAGNNDRQIQFHHRDAARATSHFRHGPGRVRTQARTSATLHQLLLDAVSVTRT